MSEQPIRVLLGKPGLDGHDRGVKVVARMLKDAGMEVIYTGLFQTPEQIVHSAIQEDVDVLGISILSGAHMTQVPRILELLEKAGAGDIPVVVGGVIPKEDMEALKARGAAAVFGPETPSELIVTTVRHLVSRRRSA